jgi:hypothetical protein
MMRLIIAQSALPTALEATTKHATRAARNVRIAGVPLWLEREVTTSIAWRPRITSLDDYSRFHIVLEREFLDSRTRLEHQGLTATPNCKLL